MYKATNKNMLKNPEAVLKSRISASHQTGKVHFSPDRTKEERRIRQQIIQEIKQEMKQKIEDHLSKRYFMKKNKPGVSGIISLRSKHLRDS